MRISCGSARGTPFPVMLRVMPQQDDLTKVWESRPPVGWAENQAYRVAREIRRLRGKRSAQWLADRTKELGCQVSRSVISDLELGRRRYVTTSELMILARALDTYPLVLMCPPPYDVYVDALPNAEPTMKIVAAEWFSGNLGSSDAARVFGADADELGRNGEPLGRARLVFNLELELREGRETLASGELSEKAQEAYVRAMGQIRDQINNLRAMDEWRPAFDEFVMHQFGE